MSDLQVNTVGMASPAASATTGQVGQIVYLKAELVKIGSGWQSVTDYQGETIA
jgi:hypothetical protein